MSSSEWIQAAGGCRWSVYRTERPDLCQFRVDAGRGRMSLVPRGAGRTYCRRGVEGGARRLDNDRRRRRRHATR